MNDFFVVIPARYASERLPGKPLMDIAGKTMLEHVYENACKSSAKQVVIATEDKRIASIAGDFGADVCLTSRKHFSGTDRIAEVSEIRKWSANQIIVNLQGDEPFMQPSLIDYCANLIGEDVLMSTLASPISSKKDIDNPNLVKVLLDKKSFALYFSRSSIPFQRSSVNLETVLRSVFRHHGVYAYYCSVLREIVAHERPPIEVCESLEQLRALFLGVKIKVGISQDTPGLGVDTEKDLNLARKLMS
tara:strand:+ start:89 stop:829 length:741 start_codon:yes stop_codon:yes gene_type:complete